MEKKLVDSPQELIGILLFFAPVIITILCYFAKYKVKKEKAFEYKYGKKALSELKKWRKKKNKDKNKLPEVVINYNDLSKLEVKQLMFERGTKLHFIDLYGNKEFAKYKQYKEFEKNNKLDDLELTKQQIDDLLAKEKEAMEMARSFAEPRTLRQLDRMLD